MSTGPERPLVAALRHELNALRGHWFWFVPLGIAGRPGPHRPRLCLALVRCPLLSVWQGFGGPSE